MDTLTAAPADTQLIARAAWSAIADPGDIVAGAFTRLVGHEEALAILRDGDVAGAVLEHGAYLDSATVHSTVGKWRARMTFGIVDDTILAAQRGDITLLAPSTVPGLADLGDAAPHIVWVRGDASAVTANRSLSVIGARAATSYGEHSAAELVHGLVGAGVVIHSGGSFGIDGAAHRAALTAGGRTVVWLASGVDRPYPAGHDSLIRRIADEPGSAVVSIVPPREAPTKWRFEQRNAALVASTLGTVVVEAGHRSGALNAAVLAAKLGRPIGAVPGPITSSTSVGCHSLIRERGARLIADATDALAFLEPVGGRA